MAHELPPSLRAALDRLLEGVSRKDLARRAAAISERYRAGGTSIALSTREDALAYGVSRMPATYAAIDAVLAEVRLRAARFAPESMLDAGAGPGTASWAGFDTWPGIASLTMVDANGQLLDLAAELGAEVPALSGASQILADFARPGALPSADLVIAGFALAEVAAPRFGGVVAALWEATRGVLVIVEPGTPAGFERIRAARAALIGAGGIVVAPCPHDEACPIVAPDWCHFAVRLPRLRHHMIAKGAVVPFEDEKFSYVAVARERFGAATAARILSPPHMGKGGLGLRLCTKDGIVARSVPRRDRAAFAGLRHARWGDGLDEILP